MPEPAHVLRMLLPAVLALLVACQPGPPRQAPDGVPDNPSPGPTAQHPTVVPLLPSAVGPQVLARIGGQSLSLIVSTTMPGALQLTPTAATRCELRWPHHREGAADPRPGDRFVAARLQIGDIRYHEVYGTVGALDDPSLAISTDPSADGRIGIDLLVRPPVVIDMVRDSLTLSVLGHRADELPGPPPPAVGGRITRPADWHGVVLDTGHDAPVVRARLDGHEQRLAISTQLPSMLFSAAGPVHVAALELDGFDFGAFAFGPVPDPDALARILDTRGLDGVLGVEFLGSHALLLDLWTHRAWIETRPAATTLPLRFDTSLLALRQRAPVVLVDGPGRRMVLADHVAALPADVRLDAWAAVPLSWHDPPVTSPLRIDGVERTISWSLMHESAAREPGQLELAALDRTPFGRWAFRGRLPEPARSNGGGPAIHARLGRDWLAQRVVCFHFPGQRAVIQPGY